MTATQPSASEPAGKMPTVSPALLRTLPRAVVVTLLVTGALIAGIVFLSDHDAGTWKAFAGASVVATIGAIASVAIILMSAGKPADYVITMVMALAGVRTMLSVGGILVLALALKMALVPVAMMICGYYAGTLIVESLVVSQSFKSR